MENQLIMTQTDYQKLLSLLSFADPMTAELLQQELDRAIVVAGPELPQDAVCMNSKVEFKDLDTGEVYKMTLVYPYEANIKEHKISILAPVGAALIGLRVGQTMTWPTPRSGQKRLQVTSVLFQDEGRS